VVVCFECVCRVCFRNGSEMRVCRQVCTLKGDSKRKGHSKRVLTAAFSADGKRVVSGSDDNLLKIWDAVNGAEV